MLKPKYFVSLAQDIQPAVFSVVFGKYIHPRAVLYLGFRRKASAQNCAKFLRGAIGCLVSTGKAQRVSI